MDNLDNYYPIIEKAIYAITGGFLISVGEFFYQEYQEFKKKTENSKIKNNLETEVKK